MSDNLKIWKAVEQPPSWALKTIGGGRLKGKTDINPQWRYHAMTEQFGPCGAGWWYTIDKQWLEPGPTEEVCAFVNITLYTESCPHGIPATGGSMLVAMEKNGLYVSDEAYKMALTDALSVAMKYLGVAAQIYYGAEATKYSKPAEPEQKKAPRKEPSEDDALLAEEAKFDLAWSGVMEDIGEDDADNVTALRRYFIKVTTEGSKQFLVMSDSLNGMSSREVAKLRAMLVKGREKVAGHCAGDWREAVGLPAIGVQVCSTCNAVLEEKDKASCAIAGLKEPYCSKHAGEALAKKMKGATNEG